MSSAVTVLVTGATGTTGSRVASRLDALGPRLRAASRRAPARGGGSSVRFDWYDPATFGEALRGVDRMYLVPPVDTTDPAAVMAPFLEQAVAAGVRRAVLLSSSAIPEGGPGAGGVHTLLPKLFDEWAVLRPSWFMQNFIGDRPHAVSIREEGFVMTATGRGRVGFIDADDIAAVAARVLTGEEPPNTDLVLTGPEALGYDDVAATISRVSGRPVRHLAVDRERMRDHLAATMPREYAAMLTDLDLAIADGAEDRVTPVVERITGLPPRSFAAVAAGWTW
ncbi:ergot alkaloid biosynthesis protein [Nocardiopsis akebiae]|uniref:Ergot alkaloid biosynthesis protein n=1 Tax=Nocardiopsis akebiae TaxID=2831968 RepID=A0ABX8C802_9ACTN|nr:NAD-dependent epimerase/dehydratase family protein [Nocardiopsis akebiae]QUX28703.1 ergot alkaloid biosynthesis protein [Nocardiopsis akebiae]